MGRVTVAVMEEVTETITGTMTKKKCKIEFFEIQRYVPKSSD